MINKKYSNGIKIKSIEGAKILKANGKVPVNSDAVFSYSMLFNKLQNIADEKGFILRNKNGYYTDDIINVSFSFGLKADELEMLGIEEFNPIVESNKRKIKERQERLIERKSNNLKKLDEIKIKKEAELIRHNNRLEEIELISKTINRKYNKDEQMIKENERYNKKIPKLNKRIEKLEEELEKIEKSFNKKIKLKGIGADEIRNYLYKNGFSINYKNGEVYKTIKYKMWFRSSAKARVGEVLFINEKYYDEITRWQSMGIVFAEGEECKLVEMMAYKSLTSSSIEGYLNLNPNNILVIDDMISKCEKKVNEVVINKEGKCEVLKDNKEISNILWDGQALLDDSLFINEAGMMLLRHHFFKACAFRTNIQLFMKDHFKEDYETATVMDRYGNNIKVKDIKLITTENAMKWEKFYKNKAEGFKVWKSKVNEDGNMFGICKTDHVSKMDNLQWMSYQMVNSLLTDKEGTRELFKTTADYINSLKDSDDNFKQYLKKTKTQTNANAMIIDLMEINDKFIKTDIYRNFKKKEINKLKDSLKKGKLLIEGDNLTVVGNPYLMLRGSVGCNELEDKTLPISNNFISVYTTRFKDGEYLGAFRNPHNAPNNVLYLKNQHSEEMAKYFKFSDNIIAVNCIGTDVQDRANSMDFDSDFILTTNNNIVVKKAKEFYSAYPTIVNSIKPENRPYTYTIENMANIDNILARGKADIGVSSNLAQVSLSYYSDSQDSEMLDTVIIMSVLSQIAIDNAKRKYAVDVSKECRRLMIKDKKPLFFKYTQSENIKSLMTREEIEELKKEYSKAAKANQLSSLNKLSSKEMVIEKIENKVKERLNNEYKNKKQELIKRFIEEWKESYKKENGKEYIDKKLPKDVEKEIKLKAGIEANERYNFKLKCPMNHLQYIVEEDIKNDTRGRHKDKTISLLSLVGKVKGKARKEHMDTVIDKVNEWDNMVEGLHSENKNLTDEKKDEFDKLEILVVEALNDAIGKLKISDKTIERLISNSLADKNKKANISDIRLKLFKTLHKNFKGQFLDLFR